MKKPDFKNIPKFIFLIIFLLVSLCPAFLFVLNFCFFNGANGATSENIEKSETLEFPHLFTDQGLNGSFDDECEAWINQNIPYRGVLISAINVALSDFMKMPVSNVVTGSEGWVYSSETVDNYIDNEAMGEADIQSMGVTLSLIQERVEENNGNFLFAPVPNKNTIYSEYMPARYIKAQENNLDRLYAEMDKVGISYVNLKSDLLKEKEGINSDRLYYKRDTHWTIFGAMAGYESMMDKLGKTSLSFESAQYSASFTRNSDLDKLLFPAFIRLEDEYFMDNLIDYEGFEFINPADVTDTKAQLENFMSDKEDHDNNFITKQRKPSDNSTLYMVRDSFGRALLPFMINSYNEATFVRTTTPSIENSINCTDVIYEICERNLKNVISSAPFMYAPKRESHNPMAVIFNSELNLSFFEDEGYAYRVYGTIDPGMTGEDGRIYVKLTDEKNESVVFEAFPIYEDVLIKDELSKAAETELSKKIADRSAVRGYSLYISKADADKDNYSVKILSGNFETDTLANLTPGSEDIGSTDEANGINGNLPNPYAQENEKHQLVYRDTTIGIGDNINALKSSLGSQAAPSEIITSCLSGKDAVLYYYPNITLETDMDGYIYYISLMDNSYSDGKANAVTAGGITIGTDKMDIWDKLGTPAKENDKNCIFTSEHLFVTYSYKSGKVTSVILEDMKYKSNVDELLADDGKKSNGVEYESGNTYLYDDKHKVKTGWQIIDGEYYFFDRQTGERIVGQTIDGIEIGPDGEVKLSDYQKDKIATMMKAHAVMEEVTNPDDTMEEKRRKVFDWVLSFPYYRPRSIKGIYNDEGIEILEANDIFEDGAGDCVSEAAALAFLFHEIGYNNVYWVHDTGHSWVRSDDKLFDPLFAESRGFEANYDAEFTDYRKTMEHSMLIY